MKPRFVMLSTFACAFVLVVLAATGTARAQARSIDHPGTYFGSVFVAPGQVIDGNVKVLFGNATIDGTVNGNLDVVGGSREIQPGGAVTGDTQSIGGDLANGFLPNAFGNDHHLVWRIAWDVVALLFFLMFPTRTRMALGRLETHPGLAVAAGLAGWVAVLPVIVLLAITIILIPLIPIVLVAAMVAFFVGKAALALLVGRRLYELLSTHTTPSPLAALILGLVLLTAAELVPIVGIFVVMLIALVGLGAVLLTLLPQIGNTTPYYPGDPPSHPTINGPPMPAR